MVLVPRVFSGKTVQVLLGSGMQSEAVPGPTIC
jgi:hypothetical protein